MLVMQVLKSSLEKENDDHDVFGAYVAMEMRNLKTSDAQIRLRTEIRDAISRIVHEDSMDTNDHRMCHLKYNKTDEFSVKNFDQSSESSQSDSSENNSSVDKITCAKKLKKTSWELIN